MSPQPLHEGGLAEQQPALRAAEKLVAGGRDEGGARAEVRRRVGLVGQPGMGCQQAGADVGHHRYAERGELVDGDRGGEALHPEVRRVHLEHERGLVADHLAVVLQPHPVGRAHLAQPTTDRLDQLGDPEAVTDLDQLAACHHHLAAERRRAGDEGERGRSVVDHVDRARVGHRRGQSGQRRGPSRPATT